MAAIVVLNTGAQTLLKLGSGRGLINAALLGGVAAYGISTLLYVLVLGRANLSFAYPLVIGATAVATCLSGRQIMSEQITSFQWAGILLIIVGIAVVAFSRSTV